MEHAFKEAELSKPGIMKVVFEVVSEAEVQISGSKEFLKHQDVHLQVLSRAYNKKLKKKAKLRKKRYENYNWTTTCRKKPERIINIFIHPSIRPVIVTVHRNNDPRNFEVLKEFKSSDFGIKRLKKIPNELELDITLPLPEKDPSLPRGKRKATELEPETYIVGLHCNRTLHEWVKFMKNLVIEKPKHGLFFINAFGEEAFQRVEKFIGIQDDSFKCQEN
ncbi:hypothetical protein Tco_0675525 [Tanacetum coccineum]